MHSMDRETLHLALATFYHSDPNPQIKRMVKRYYRKETSPKVKRIYNHILADPNPSEMVLEVYQERFN